MYKWADISERASVWASDLCAEWLLFQSSKKLNEWEEEELKQGLDLADHLPTERLVRNSEQIGQTSEIVEITFL